jgi:hypothetical protein
MTGDIDWYVAESTTRGLSTPRCPFAAAGRCPRYYQSLALLGDAGSTKLEAKEDKRLLKKWHKSDLWPRTAEQETTVFSSDGKPYLFAKFCPEVLHDRFGWFATSLAAYPDEVDQNLAHRALGLSHAEADDWRWAWWQMTPMHYSDCPLYSLLSHNPVQQTKSEILGLKPGIWGLSIDLKALWRWLRKQ